MFSKSCGAIQSTVNACQKPFLIETAMEGKKTFLGPLQPHYNKLAGCPFGIISNNSRQTTAEELRMDNPVMKSSIKFGLVSLLGVAALALSALNAQADGCHVSVIDYSTLNWTSSDLSPEKRIYVFNSSSGKHDYFLKINLDRINSVFSYVFKRDSVLMQSGDELSLPHGQFSWKFSAINILVNDDPSFRGIGFQCSTQYLF